MRPAPAGGYHLPPIVRRRGVDHSPPAAMARPSMPPVRPPADRGAGGSSQDQHEPARARDPPHTLVKQAAFGRRCRMVAKDHPCPARQAGQGTPQRVAGTFVGHQPQIGQGLAAAHRAAYSAAMPPIETDTPPARLAAVEAGIAKAAALAGRARGAIELIAVSKTQDAATIAPLIAAGQRSFGENRVQEAQGKWPALKAAHAGIRLHLVGQLQSNKAGDAVALFDVIHSLDRPSLIAALARAMAEQGRRPDCFVQVDIGDEPQKGGCAIGDVPALLAAAAAAGLPVIGLMAVPPAGAEPAPYFALLAKLAGDHGLAGLSMGMSGDYETAVMLGATQVRVGTALFGARA